MTFDIWHLTFLQYDMSDLFIFTLADFIGLGLTLASIALVVEAATPLGPELRKGMLSLIWGLLFIALSFIWSLIFERFGIADLPNLQSVFLAFGMIWVWLSTNRLFRIYQK